MSLIAIILTHNESHNIAACIESLRWADAILVFNSFSTDNTIQIASQLGAKVIQHAFVNYTQQRNAALSAVNEDWVLFVDADERATPELATEINAAISTAISVETPIVGYWIPRHNYIFGKLTRYAGWYPDHQLRLLRRTAAHYDHAREVHEVVILNGDSGYLTQPLIHYNYRDVSQFFRKQQAYTALAAKELFRQGIRPKPQNYVLQPIRQFIWRYITLDGYKGGWHGLRLSLYMAWYEFRKYVILRQLSRQGNSTQNH